MPVPERPEKAYSVGYDVRDSGDIMSFSTPPGVSVAGEYNFNLMVMPSDEDRPHLGKDLFYKCLELQHNVIPGDIIPLVEEIPVLINIRDSSSVLSTKVYKAEYNNNFLEVPDDIYELLDNTMPVVSLPFKAQILKMYGIKPLKEF